LDTDNVADVSEVPGASIFKVEGGKMYLRNDHNTDNMYVVQREEHLQHEQ
jgi:hypothetical protein